MYRRLLILTLVLSLLTGGRVWAQTPEEEQKEKTHPLAALISSAFGLSLETIEQLHASGMGYGAMVHALSLARASGTDPNTVIAMHQSGQGWGEIARALGVHPSAKGSIGQLKKGNGNGNGNGKAKGKPDHAGKGKPDHAGKGNGNGKGKNKNKPAEPTPTP